MMGGPKKPGPWPDEVMAGGVRIACALLPHAEPLNATRPAS
jgi:hypothetical protein